MKILGFRSGKVWKKVLATIGYAFMILVVLSVITGKNDTKPTTTANPPVVTPAPTSAPAPTPPPVVTPAPAPTLSNPLDSMSDSEVKATVTKTAMDKWGSDYTEAKFVIGEEMKAYNDLKKIDIKSEDQLTILKDALNQWGSDYSEAQFVYGEQIKAYNDLHK